MANTQTSVPVFTVGQILTAQQQTEINTGIPVFATTVTRDAAFGGAGEKVLAEGQACYIEDTNRIQVYDGSSFRTIDVGAYTAYTPTVSAVTGTITTKSGTGAFALVGKTCFVRFQLSITTNGTGGTAVVFTLPVTGSNGYASSQQAVGVARESGPSGALLQVTMGGVGPTTANCFTATNGYPGADGAAINGTICYEIA